MGSQTMAVVKKKLRKNKKDLKEATTLQTNSTRYKRKRWVISKMIILASVTLT
jgi:hypothetical protein